MKLRCHDRDRDRTPAQPDIPAFEELKFVFRFVAHARLLPPASESDSNHLPFHTRLRSLLSRPHSLPRKSSEEENMSDMRVGHAST